MKLLDEVSPLLFDSVLIRFDGRDCSSIVVVVVPVGMGGSLVECEPKIPWLESEGDVACADPIGTAVSDCTYRFVAPASKQRPRFSPVACQQKWIGWDGMQQRKSLNDVERFSWTVLLFKARAIGTD